MALNRPVSLMLLSLIIIA